MKKVIIIYLLLTVNYYNFAQKAKDLRFSAMSEISFLGNGILTSYGLNAEYFINKNFSLNYQYSLGINQFNNTYLHYPGAIAGLVEMLRTDSYYFTSGSNDDGWAYIMILSCIIPEGVSFHTYPRKWLEIAPFINPFACDFNILNNDRSTLTFSLGLKTYIKPIYNFSITPYFGLKHIYRNSKAGSLFGFSVGYLF